MEAKTIPGSDQVMRYVMAYLKEGDRAKARQALRWLLQRDPKHVVAWTWLAYLSTDPREVEACWRRIQALNPLKEGALAQVA